MIPLLALASLFALSTGTFGAPTEAIVAGQTIPLLKRNPSPRDVTEWAALAKKQRDTLIAKYGGNQTIEKRSTGYNLYVVPRASDVY